MYFVVFFSKFGPEAASANARARRAGSSYCSLAARARSSRSCAADITLIVEHRVYQDVSLVEQHAAIQISPRVANRFRVHFLDT